MGLTSGQITTLLALQKPLICAYWKVYWDFGNTAEDRYYSDSPYQELSGFLNIGLTLEEQLFGNVWLDTQFEINPDIKAEKINIKFSDVAVNGVKPISSRFETYKSGVKCELFYYYADLNTHVSKWTGQLQAPDTYGHDSVEAVATNGFRSRDQNLPDRTRPRECTANFGGSQPDQEAIDTCGCPYNKHIGGAIGNYRTASIPYKSCPRNSTTACNARLGTSDGKYYLGFDTDASATVTSGNPNVGSAISIGNQSTLTKPIRVIYGQKFVREMPLLLWRRETGSSNVNNDWVSGVWEIGEGPISDAYDFRIVGSRPPQAIASQVRLGGLGQAQISNYADTMSNFSLTALFRGKYGWINAKETNASDMTCEGRVIGKNDVPVFTDATTKTRIWSDNRVWCLMDLMNNRRFGMSYPFSRFEITDWITAADWTKNSVTFSATDLDGNTVAFNGRRSTFDAICEGRPAHEQIEDICRAGALSLPFLHDGKFTLTPFRKATSGELSAARVFTDTGENVNIVWDENRPSITFGQIPDDKVYNQIELTFEEADNEDVERPFTVDDPNQKLKAGRVLGEDNLQSVPKKFSAFGIRHLHEVGRLGHRLLWFGENESGGIMNNLNGKFTTPAVYVEGLKRYDIIKIETTLDDGFTIGIDNGALDLTETPQYYRIRSMKKIGNGLVEVIIQAYNATAYAVLDVIGSVDPPIFNVCSIDADCGDGYVCVNGVCVHEPPPPPCVVTPTTVTYDSVNAHFEVIAPPC